MAKTPNTSKDPVRWGIIGTGKVTEQFCRELTRVPGVRVARVWSRSLENARRFAEGFGISGYYSNLGEFLSAGEMDVAYISSPTSLHEEHSLACLEAGVGVLCEKPLSTSVSSAQRIFARAREKNRFCMEGMWMRFNPLVQKAGQIIKSGQIGELVSMRAELGYQKDFHGPIESARSVLWNLGVYPLSLFHYMAGLPQRTFAVGNGAGVQVSRRIAGVLDWSGFTGTFVISDQVELSNEAVFVGTEATLRLGSPFICPQRLESSKPIFPGNAVTGKVERFLNRNTGRHFLSDPFVLTASQNSGFYFEALAATEAVRKEEIQSASSTWDNSLDVIELSEKIEKLI